MIDTSGYKGWWPLKFFEGKNWDGTPKTTEGFKNVLTGQEVTPEKGHNGEPPGPTGEIVRHSSNAYKIGWERIWGSASPQSGS